MAWAKQEDAWERASLLAAIWTERNPETFQPFAEGRPKRRQGTTSDPTRLKYNPGLLERIQTSGVFRGS